MFLHLILTVTAQLAPLYLFNHDVPQISTPLSDEAFQISVSHFLGDGQQALNHELSNIISQISSPFLQDTKSTVLVAKNINESLVEKMLGSPQLLAESEGVQNLKLTSFISPENLQEELLNYDGKVVYINTNQNGVDFTEEVVQSLLNSDSRVMLVCARAPQQSSSQLTQRSVSAFFGTLDECNESTNSCSGQGECVKSSGRYICKCTPKKVGDYTYYFGGYDCSKRDVSFQFSLLVGTTLAIVFAGVLSVKLLWSLGSESLPSVLTAN